MLSSLFVQSFMQSFHTVSHSSSTKRILLANMTPKTAAVCRTNTLKCWNVFIFIYFGLFFSKKKKIIILNIPGKPAFKPFSPQFFFLFCIFFFCLKVTNRDFLIWFLLFFLVFAFQIFIILASKKKKEKHFFLWWKVRIHGWGKHKKNMKYPKKSFPF